MQTVVLLLTSAACELHIMQRTRPNIVPVFGSVKIVCMVSIPVYEMMMPSCGAQMDLQSFRQA